MYPQSSKQCSSVQVSIVLTLIQENASHAGKKVQFAVSTQGRRNHTFPFFKLRAELRNTIYGWVPEKEAYEFGG
jgi:hypothetical protein